jgi:hypothetical protein
MKSQQLWTLTEPLDFGWAMKPVESAETHMEVLSDARLQLTIVHDVLKDITPTMLHWWFAHIGGEMSYCGKTYNRYHVWHPRDHIHWALAKPGPNGTAEAGAVFHIVEAFGRNPAFLIDVHETVEKLDDSGIRLSNVRAGMTFSTLEHTFTPVDKGTLYRSRLVVGSDHPLVGAIFNRLVRPRVFPDEKGRAWLKHNVEEVGNLEFFLPDLYLQHG